MKDALNLEEINLNGTQIDTSNVRSMERMFYGCRELSTFDVVFNMNNVSNIKEMFEGCKNLNSVDFGCSTLQSDCDLSDMFRDCNPNISIKCEDEVLARFRLNGLPASIHHYLPKSVVDSATLSQQIEVCYVCESGEISKSKIRRIFSQYPGLTKIRKYDPKLDSCHVPINFFDSDPVKYFVEGDTLLIGSSTPIFMPECCLGFFANLSHGSLDIDLRDIDCSKIRNAYAMFALNRGLNVVLDESFSSCPIVYTNYMFSYCSLDNLSLELNTSENRNMDGMFANTVVENYLSLKNFDLSRNANFMFKEFKAKKICLLNSFKNIKKLYFSNKLGFSDEQFGFSTSSDPDMLISTNVMAVSSWFTSNFCATVEVIDSASSMPSEEDDVDASAEQKTESGESSFWVWVSSLWK